MADTIISNIPNSGDDSGGAGWVVALVIILVVIIGGVVLYQKGFFDTSTPKTTNINVTIPNPTTPGTTTK